MKLLLVNAQKRISEVKGLKYYEITLESPAYEMCGKFWGYKENWDKANEEITNLIGCDTNNNLIYNEHRLCLVDVPKPLKDQFCKNGWDNNRVYPAKKSSDIQKQFLAIADKYQLVHYTLSDIATILGTFLQGGNESYHPPMDGKFYIQTERKITNMTGLVEIPESMFLRLRADWLERNERT